MNILEHGIEIVKNVVATEVMDAIKLETAHQHGVRNAEKKFPTIFELVNSPKFLERAKSILGGKPKIVRVIFFDKTPDKNWLVTWHQDKTIAVSSKVEISYWGPWSVKDGIHHVQPSLNVLNKMVTFRLHLDDANAQNGCLKVIPKSNHLGILPQAKIDTIVQTEPVFACEVQAGDMIIMRPHILHASSKSSIPEHRRVVHVEYSDYELPHRLNWV